MAKEKSLRGKGYLNKKPIKPLYLEKDEIYQRIESINYNNLFIPEYFLEQFYNECLVFSQDITKENPDRFMDKLCAGNVSIYFRLITSLWIRRLNTYVKIPNNYEVPKASVSYLRKLKSEYKLFNDVQDNFEINLLEFEYAVNNIKTKEIKEAINEYLLVLPEKLQSVMTDYINQKNVFGIDLHKLLEYYKYYNLDSLVKDYNKLLNESLDKHTFKEKIYENPKPMNPEPLEFQYAYVNIQPVHDKIMYFIKSQKKVLSNFPDLLKEQTEYILEKRANIAIVGVFKKNSFGDVTKMYCSVCTYERSVVDSLFTKTLKGNLKAIFRDKDDINKKFKKFVNVMPVMTLEENNPFIVTNKNTLINLILENKDKRITIISNRKSFLLDKIKEVPVILTKVDKVNNLVYVRDYNYKLTEEFEQEFFDDNFIEKELIHLLEEGNSDFKEYLISADYCSDKLSYFSSKVNQVIPMVRCYDIRGKTFSFLLGHKKKLTKIKTKE